MADRSCASGCDLQRESMNKMSPKMEKVRHSGLYHVFELRIQTVERLFKYIGLMFGGEGITGDC